jgi:hypothetical protein
MHGSFARANRLAPVLATLGLAAGMLAGSQPATALDQQAAPPLGRLFMSPEERRALDAGRAPYRNPDEPDNATPAPGPSPVLLNGILRRSKGPAVVWINGQTAGGRDAVVQVRRGPDRQNSVTVFDPADGRSVSLKPGESWTP